MFLYSSAYKLCPWLFGAFSASGHRGDSVYNFLVEVLAFGDCVSFLVPIPVLGVLPYVLAYVPILSTVAQVI